MSQRVPDAGATAGWIAMTAVGALGLVIYLAVKRLFRV
jgi:hypothetical protein